jgi:SAM-dependent methyltransferase
MNQQFNPQEYWEKRLSPGPGLHLVGHLAYGHAFNKALYDIRKHIFHSVIAQYLPDISQKDILDIGCGTGFYLEQWQKYRTASIKALDFTNAAVEFCAKQYPDITVFQADISDTELLNHPALRDGVDVISVFDVLFHIVNDIAYENALSNIASLLRPGGILLYADNFIHGQTKREKHIVHRPLNYIQNVLENKGFTVLQRRPLFWLMGYPVDSRSSLRGWLWRAFMYPVRHSEIIGAVYAAVLKPIELALLALCRESPTTELMICRKK